MGYNARKTEHVGPKKGSGAFYGRKALARRQAIVVAAKLTNKPF